MDALKGNCILRQISTSIKTKDSDHDIWVLDSDEPAEWVPSNSYQKLKEVAAVFSKKPVK